MPTPHLEGRRPHKGVRAQQEGFIGGAFLCTRHLVASPCRITRKVGAERRNTNSTTQHPTWRCTAARCNSQDYWHPAKPLPVARCQAYRTALEPLVKPASTEVIRRSGPQGCNRDCCACDAVHGCTVGGARRMSSERSGKASSGACFLCILSLHEQRKYVANRRNSNYQIAAQRP